MVKISRKSKVVVTACAVNKVAGENGFIYLALSFFGQHLTFNVSLIVKMTPDVTTMPMITREFLYYSQSGYYATVHLWSRSLSPNQLCISL